MNDKLRRAIEESHYIHAPIPFDPSEAAEVRLAAKPVVRSRPLNITDSLEGWETQGKYGTLELSSEYSVNGNQTLLMTSPTRIDTWEHDYARIYATPSILHRFSREDWTEYNRISFQVRPELPGFKFVSLHLQLINEGEYSVPDFYYREGCHNMNLINHTWNRVVLEIPNIERDCITGLYFGYDIVGHENEAAKTAQFYIKDIALEVIEEADNYKGWEVEPGRISICGSGYQTGSSKTAIAGKMKADSFKLVQADTGKVVLEKKIRQASNGLAEFGVLDFSEMRESGSYLIVAGDVVTRVFPIGDQVWEDSVWKTINLFFCERCGFEVPGVHKYCHGNVVNKHGDKSVVANGGWHDAADMSQNLTNTGEAVYAFFAAALRFQEDKPLFARLVEEGKWGLEWMLKTRFGDGFRTMGSGTSVWTSGILGAEDQINFDHIEPFRQDDAFSISLDIRDVPSSPTLRQRLDMAGASAWKDILLQESADLLHRVKAPLTGVELYVPGEGAQTLLPLNIDVSPLTIPARRRKVSLALTKVMTVLLQSSLIWEEKATGFMWNCVRAVRTARKTPTNF